MSILSAKGVEIRSKSQYLQRLFVLLLLNSGVFRVYGLHNDVAENKNTEIISNMRGLDSVGPIIQNIGGPAAVQNMKPAGPVIQAINSGATVLQSVVPMILKSLNISNGPTMAMVSNQCRFDIELSIDSFNGIASGKSTTEEWGRQMNEAFGKMPGGITQGNLYWMGDFWQCMAINVWRYANSSEAPPKTHSDFTGKYCLVSVAIPLVPLPSLKVGTCFPSSCNSHDVQELVTSSLPFLFRAMVNESFCQTTNDSKWDAVSRSISFVMCAFISFVIIATVFEIVLKIKSTVKPDNLHESNEGTAITTKSVLLSFSAISNTIKLFRRHPPQTNRLSCLHGLRAISISWVILGHTFMLIHQDYPWKNQLHALPFLKDFLFQAIFGGEYAVDTFLCMSGFLVTYLFLEEMQKRDGKMNFFVYYLHRIWRLVPAYALVIAYMSGPFGGLGSGPIWPAAHGDMTDCRKRWWQNLLFINVYYDEKDQCLPQAWYLCLDLTFYFLAPLILYPLFKKPRLGHLIYLIFFVVSYVIPAWIIQQDGLASFPAWNAEHWQRDQFMNKVYNKPWCRMSAYLIGMLYGYLLYLMGTKTGSTIMRPMVVIIGWFVAIVTSLAIIYSTYPVLKGDKEMHHIEFVFYGALVRPAWAASVGWVMLACATGYGGYANSILAWSGFQPFSRLTYTAYLVHFTVAAHFFATRTDSIYIDYYIMAFFGIAMYFITMLFAMLLTITSESPFMALEKILLRRLSHPERLQVGDESGKLITGTPSPTATLQPTARRRPPPITKQRQVDEHQDLHYHPLVSATSDSETVYHDLEDTYSLRSDYESPSEDTIYTKPTNGAHKTTRHVF